MSLRLGASCAGIAFSLFIASPAFAQQAHSAAEFYALPSDAAGSVGVRPAGASAPVRSVVGLPAPTSRTTATVTTRGAQSAPADQQRARERFEQGVRYADALQWAEAADAFEESYRLFPRPATLRNLGLAHRALGRYTHAIQELQQFLEEGNPESDVAQQVHQIITDMRSELATVTVVPSVSSVQLTLDDQPVHANEEIQVDPGNHVVTGTAQGYARAAQTFTLHRSEQRRVELHLERTGGGGILSQWWFWTGVGVIVAGGVAVGAVVLLSHEAPPNCGTLNVCVSPQ
jgi:tetratricopeptide (TPR) repeat protein